MLCIYEKLKEQQSKGIECKQKYWTRYEMRFTQSRANDFSYNFLKIQIKNLRIILWLFFIIC